MPPKKPEPKKDEKRCVNGKCSIPKKDVKKGGGCGCSGTPMNS